MKIEIKRMRVYGNTKGYAELGGRLSLIMQNGVNTHTLSHEALHTRYVDHTFKENKSKSKYLFTKYRTDNIMDYLGEGKKEKQMQATYKWQWDAVREFANQDNIYHKLQKESD
ncbi:hypothetical protein [Capnocytophaga sputigena]|uniref:hypothetical protein n=1 Tax=Capnocytophaga sputigena TaxID=1019 RepID=UPI00241F0C4A